MADLTPRDRETLRLADQFAADAIECTAPGSVDAARERLITHLSQPSAVPAEPSGAEQDRTAEALRQALNKLPRYSFHIDSRGNLRRVHEHAGNWIEWQQAHELFDPVAVDALRAAADDGHAPYGAGPLPERGWDEAAAHSQPAEPSGAERALRSALNAMLTQFGMDEDEWSKPTFDQARRALAAAPSREPEPAQAHELSDGEIIMLMAQHAEKVPSRLADQCVALVRAALAQAEPRREPAPEQIAALDRMVADAEKLGLYDEPAQPAQAAEPTGWQPIETAPKNGTSCLVCSDGGDIWMAHWVVRLRAGGRWENYGLGALRFAPTHWMSLPTPPADTLPQRKD